MPTLQVKFIAGELAPGLKNGEYEIPDGLTVREALAVCEKVCGALIPKENFKLMYPLFNGKPIQMSNAIDIDGKLYICRIAMGG